MGGTAVYHRPKRVRLGRFCFLEVVMRKILVSDVSLKAIHSGMLSFKEKLEIAKSLSDLGIDVLELSIFTGDKADDVLVKTVSSCVTKSIISSYCGNTLEDVEKAYLAIANAKKKRLLVSVPVSSIQMEYFVSKKPVAVLELLKNLTDKAVSLCSDVEVSLEDATRAEPEFLYKAIDLAINCGAKTICLSDLSGNLMPEEFCAFINGVYENCPSLKKVNLAISVSDELSLGTSCILSALNCGASAVKISALKLNNLPKITKVLSAIEIIGGKNGYACSIDKTKQKLITSKISEITAEKNGDGIISNAREKSEELSPDLSEKQITELVKKMGYQLTKEDYAKIYADYQRLAGKKNVSNYELNVIVATVAMQVPETYSLISYSVQSSNVLTATASIVLNKNGKQVSGLSYGNGSVDAAFRALENICGRHFELDDFELGAVTEGKDSIGQALVRLRANGKVFSGRGVSTDIVGASIKAYLSALNKIVYEENN